MQPLAFVALSLSSLLLASSLAVADQSQVENNSPAVAQASVAPAAPVSSPQQNSPTVGQQQAPIAPSQPTSGDQHPVVESQQAPVVPQQQPQQAPPQQQPQQQQPQQPIVHVVELHHHHQHPHQQAQPQVNGNSPGPVVVSGVASPSGPYHAPQPAGIIQVVQGTGGNEPQVSYAGAQQKLRNLVVASANQDQYGQPESASLPANYRAFGSWGLYIGGNPADGYYTNYYKALGNTVDKQQAANGNQVSALSPILKQASESPYAGADYYPFAYSPSELNSGRQIPLSLPAAGSQYYYGSPKAYPSPDAVAYYHSYDPSAAYPAPVVAKRTAAPGVVHQAQQKDAYYYSHPIGFPVSAAPSAPVNQAPSQQQQQQQQQQQLVAYPIPVGSQIVGSQPGVDGAFSPYGIHAFTRYAIKPTVISNSQTGSSSATGTNSLVAPTPVSAVTSPGSEGFYYNQPAPFALSSPSYKQPVALQPHQQQQHQQPQAAHSPFAYYGYPMSQLHYSNGPIAAGKYQYQASGVADQSPASHVIGHHSLIETSASEKNEAKSDESHHGPNNDKHQHHHNN